MIGILVIEILVIVIYPPVVGQVLDFIIWHL